MSSKIDSEDVLTLKRRVDELEKENALLGSRVDIISKERTEYLQNVATRLLHL